MAQSPAHQFGQIIGDVLEAAILPLLEGFAADHGLYLDKKGSRPCRPGRKCSWRDRHGNSHDLDFVLERGGTSDAIGMPAAFIECAWRRYTKHSRNKAQEIQGALEPLADSYRNLAPFKGVVLAGVFTAGAISQLESLGFAVLYVPYESIVEAFAAVGIDARFDETTSDRSFAQRVRAFKRLNSARRTELTQALLKKHSRDVATFLTSLANSVSRQIERVIVLALHGRSAEAYTIDDAIRLVTAYSGDGRQMPIERFEIEIRFNNGDSVRGSFSDKSAAIEFLKSYQPVLPIEP
ncbi:MAG: hypothetical protein K2Y37_18590 [Pirellulales bacterium]|nr:hypothetical protein [Pirellulales bacterium]